MMMKGFCINNAGMNDEINDGMVKECRRNVINQLIASNCSVCVHCAKRG